MVRYDVIVAGAGPAGSTAARECASRGLSVLLLDKAEFPRDKPCGGGVNVRASRLLPFDISPVTERVIFGMHVSMGQSRGYTRYSAQPLSFLTQRRRLDTFLLEQARRAGATIRERTLARTVERDSTCVVVRAGSESFEGRTLVAADGANGTVWKQLGLILKRSTGIALEGNVTPGSGYPDRWRDVLGIDVASVPGGYGWIFPKGDHLNIGVGGTEHVGPSLRTRLHELSRFYGFDPERLWGLRGHPLPVRLPNTPLVDGNVLLVGDAGGLVDALTGEGIYSAIWSGQAAARHLAAFLQGDVPNLDGYQCDIDRELGMELSLSLQFHLLFHLSPSVWAAMVARWPRAWRLVCSLLTGEQTYAGALGKHPLLSRGFDLGADAFRFALARSSPGAQEARPTVPGCRPLESSRLCNLGARRPRSRPPSAKESGSKR